MSERKIKTKDMVISIFCTILTILLIVFYFLPAFNIKEGAAPSADSLTTHVYSTFEMTLAAFTNHKVIGFNWDILMYVKDLFGVEVVLIGVLSPLAILCALATTVFAYLSWFKGEKFKKFCFIFSILVMVAQTITLVLTWFIALTVRSDNTAVVNALTDGGFMVNILGGMSYGGFVSLIIAFVIAIVGCAYNYFIDDASDEDDEDDDEEEDEDEDERPRKKKQQVEESEVTEDDEVESNGEEKAVVTKPASTTSSSRPKKTTSTKSSTSAKSSTSTKTSTTAKTQTRRNASV